MQCDAIHVPRTGDAMRCDAIGFAIMAGRWDTMRLRFWAKLFDAMRCVESALRSEMTRYDAITGCARLIDMRNYS